MEFVEVEVTRHSYFAPNGWFPDIFKLNFKPEEHENLLLAQNNKQTWELSANAKRNISRRILCQLQAFKVPFLCRFLFH